MEFNYETLANMSARGPSNLKPSIEKWYSTPIKTVYELNKNSLTELPSGPAWGPKQSIARHQITKQEMSKGAKTMALIALIIVLLIVAFFFLKGGGSKQAASLYF